MSKRHFAEYGTQTPQEVDSGGWIMKHVTKLGDEELQAYELRNSASKRHEMDTPINELVAARGDLERVKSKICSLTNELHPLFDETNICACKHEDAKFCYEPTYAAALEMTKDLSRGSLELNWAHPLENFMLRASLQLATCMITDKDTLPFWAGFIAAGEGPEEEKEHFHVPARRIDTPENAMLENKTLDDPVKVASGIRFHFKAFQDLRHRIRHHYETTQSGFCTHYHPLVEDPEPRLAQFAGLISAASEKEPSFDSEQVEAVLEPTPAPNFYYCDKGLPFCG